MNNILKRVRIWFKRFYNPYKPHIVHSRALDCYCIRKYNWVIGWEYMDKSDYKNFWWTDETYIKKYCKFDTLDLAKTRLLEYNHLETINAEGFVRVYDKE
jgi:hypothetical protein